MLDLVGIIDEGELAGPICELVGEIEFDSIEGLIEEPQELIGEVFFTESGLIEEPQDLIGEIYFTEESPVLELLGLVDEESIEGMIEEPQELIGEVFFTERGPPGSPGPSGAFEIVPVTIISINTWTPVPLAFLTIVADAEVYDQSNQEKVIIDIRILSGSIVEVRSKSLKTFNVHVMGA